MSEPSTEEKVSAALSNIGALGVPIKELVASVKELTKKIDELILALQNNQR